MWKTQHMAVLAVAVTIVSITLTLYAQSRIQHAIAAKAAELARPQENKKPNPIKLMSALSSKKIHPNDKSPSSIPPPSLEDPTEETRKTVPPKGAGSRWTPL